MRVHGSFGVTSLEQMHSMQRLVALSVTILLLGCPKEEAKKPLSAHAVCEKIAALQDGAPSPKQKDQCEAELASLGPNLHACFDACVGSAKSAYDFDDCKDDCTGSIYPADMVCSKKTTDGQAVDRCSKAHAALQSSAPEVYKCWTRCGRRATPAEVDACDVRCKVPAY
jgi:hypothetical protein